MEVHCCAHIPAIGRQLGYSRSSEHGLPQQAATRARACGSRVHPPRAAAMCPAEHACERRTCGSNRGRRLTARPSRPRPVGPVRPSAGPSTCRAPRCRSRSCERPHRPARGTKAGMARKEARREGRAGGRNPSRAGRPCAHYPNHEHPRGLYHCARVHVGAFPSRAVPIYSAQPYNSRTTAAQQPYNSRTTAVQQPFNSRTASGVRYGTAGTASPVQYLPYHAQLQQATLAVPHG
jgi:hypothetical protein